MNHGSYAPATKSLGSKTSVPVAKISGHWQTWIIPHLLITLCSFLYLTLQLLNDQHGLAVISSPHPALIYAWGWPHTTASLNGLFGLWMYLSVKDAVSDLPISLFRWHIAASTYNYLPESLPSSCKSTGQSRSSESICPGEAISQ